MYTYIATAPAKATQENSLDISLLRMIFFSKNQSVAMTHQNSNITLTFYARGKLWPVGQPLVV